MFICLSAISRKKLAGVFLLFFFLFSTSFAETLPPPPPLPPLPPPPPLGNPASTDPPPPPPPQNATTTTGQPPPVNATSTAPTVPTLPPPPTLPTQPPLPGTQTSTSSPASGASQASTTAPQLALGQKVSAPSFVNVQATPNGVFVVLEKAGNTGRIISGPVEAGGSRWWQVVWIDGKEGWSTENSLATGEGVKTGGTQIPGTSGTTVPTTGTVPSSPQFPGQHGTTRDPFTQTPTQLPRDATSLSITKNSRVRTTSAVNIRANPAGSLVGRASKGRQGVVIDGPVVSGNHTWWKIDYDDSPDGWSAGDWFVKNDPVSGATFTKSSRIMTEETLKVRANPGGTLLGTAKGGALGTIVDGPMNAGNHTWWKIDYDTGPDGWSAQDWLSTNLSAALVALSVGDRVAATATLNVRETPNGNILARVPLNTAGKIISGPHEQNGHTWWKIDYDTGPDGWSASNWLTKK